MNEMQHPPSGPMELSPVALAEAFGRLRRALRRRRRTFLVVFGVIFSAIQAFAFFWPGTYAARAAILVQQTRFATRLSAASEDPTTVLTAGVSEEQVNSEIAVLTSQEVLAATVTSTGLDQAPPPWYLRTLFYPLYTYERLYARYHGVAERTPTDRALQGLATSLAVEHLKDSNILVVTFESRDPQVAEIVLDQLLKHYLDHHLRVHGPQEVAPFFDRQADFLKQELNRHEDDLQALKRALGTTDVAAETNVQLELDAILRKESTELERRLAELDGRIATLGKTLVDAAESAASGVEVPLSDPILPKLKAEVLDLELEQIRLETRYQSDFPLLVENRRQLELARRALEDERRNVFEHSPTLLAVDRDLTSLAAERVGVLERRRVLEVQLQASRARLLELDRQATEATRAQRQIRANEEKYLKYLARFEDARIDAALDQSRFANVSIIQGAAASPKPVRPKKLMVLVTSLFGGALAGWLVCLLLELKALGLAGILASVLPRAETS